MLKDEIIIINTSGPLRNYMKRRPTHYAEILSCKNRVINVSSASFRDYFRPKNKCNWEEKIFFRLPGERFKLVQKFNKHLYSIFLKKFMKTLPQKPILWHFYSGNYDVVSSLPNKLSILEICDDTPEFFAGNPQRYEEVKQNEDKMAKSADIVFTISDYLKKKKTAIRPDIKVIRNGADYEDFAVTISLSKNQSDELFNYKLPIVGYCGAISKWFDFELVEGVAQRLKDVNFVFLGRINTEQQPVVDRLNLKPNIHFLGERPYRDLPHYLKYFELCHIPFILNELVASVNPIKLYEYLAAGKRVISTPLPEVLLCKKGGIVETANGIEEYTKAIKKMLTEDSGYPENVCQLIATENTWQSRVEAACEIVIQRLNSFG